MMFVQNSRKRYWLLFLCISLLLISSSVYRLSAGDPCTDTCYVDAVNGNDANGGASPADAKATIQAAVDQVDDGGTVNVAAGTYVENVVITKNVTINGAGQTTTIVDGNAAGSVFQIGTGSNVTLVLTDMKITNGLATFGGGVSTGNLGNVEIEDSIITDNTADNGGGVAGNEAGELHLTNVEITDNTATTSGGGVYKNEQMSITDSTISGNTAPDGAGIRVSDSGLFQAATITNSHIDDNIGTGVYSEHINLTINGGTVSNNQGTGIVTVQDGLLVDGVTVAMNDDDGIYAGADDTTIQNSLITQNGNHGVVSSGFGFGEIPNQVMVINSQITNNQGRGAVAEIRSWLMVSYSTISGNQDGGVLIFGTRTIGTISYSTISGNTTTGDGGGVLFTALGFGSISNSTISGNQADGNGGGVANFGGLDVEIENSTISGNTADVGGGIFNTEDFNLGRTLVSFITVTDNTAGTGAGIYNGATEPNRFRVQNSIIATNNGDNCGWVNPLSPDGENISDDATCDFGAGDNANADLGPLQDNGGTTLTHAPASTSDAIDIVTTCTDLDSNPLTIDQRGFLRPVGAACDAGAVEVDEEPPPVCDPNPAADLSQSQINWPYDNATVINTSDACSYEVGFAVYKVIDGTVSTQLLHDAVSMTVGPGETINLNLDLPTCMVQIDLFYGSVITDLSQERYGERLLDYQWLNGTGLCADPINNDPPEEPPVEDPPQNDPPVNDPPQNDPPVCNPNPSADLRHSQSHLNAPFDNGTVVNLSDACTYDIGIASYSVMDGSVGTQQLLGSQTMQIGPGQTVNLGPVPIDSCTTQVDLFYGGVITDFSGGARYGDRLIDVRWVGSGNCTNE